ncbi:hypothetical protein Tco_1508006 [Tanacetum coccineum]
MFDTLLPFSSENDDKVFNPGILALSLIMKRHLLIAYLIGALKVPAQGLGDRVNAHNSSIAPDYEASRARGFVLRSLELQSFA